MNSWYSIALGDGIMAAIAAKEIAKAFAAQPCEGPARAGLGLLAGDERCWSVIFVESAG